VCALYLMMIIIVYFVSSSYLLVFGDDRVTRDTRAKDISCGGGEA